MMSLVPKSITSLDVSSVKSVVSDNCEVLIMKILKQGTDTLETLGLCQDLELYTVGLSHGMAQVDLQEFRVRDISKNILYYCFQELITIYFTFKVCMIYC